MEEPMLAGEPLLSWRAPEHIHVRPNPRGLMVSTVLLALIIAYAIFTNSPIMAIPFSITFVRSSIIFLRGFNAKKYKIKNIIVKFTA
jgi:hypothetical protein